MSSRISYYLVSILFLLGFSFAFGTSVRGQDSSQPPVNDFYPNKWHEYSSPLGGYRIRFPMKPQDISKLEGQYESRGMEYKGLLIYRVVYIDYQVPIEDPQNVKDLLQALKETTLNAVRDHGLLVVEEREVMVDGHHGIFVHLELQRKDVIRMQWVIVGSRRYTISTLSRKASATEAGSKDDYESISAAFINSFHITPD
jgi:hypothetical protein